VVVFNGVETTESQAAELAVSAPPLPFRDDFAYRESTNSASGAASAKTLKVQPKPANPTTPANPRPFDLVLLGRTCDGIALFHTRGSDFDTLLAVYTNDVVSDPHVVAADDDRGGFLTSLVSFNAAAGTEYQIAVDGFFGSTVG